MALVSDKDRNIIPRWRDSNRAARTGEISPTTVRIESIPRSGEILEKRIAEWSTTESTAIAGEVLGSSLLTGTYSDRVLAIARSISSNSRATNATRSLALLVLGQGVEDEQEIDGVEPRLASQKRIHSLRKRLREDPRNAIAWANAALHYTRIAQIDKAVAAMRNAVILAPDNRFILRSAARLHIHRGRPEVAHELLLSSGATQHDPWLLAAEIATASSMKSEAFFIKDGRNVMKSGNYSDFHTAELASALGTNELNSGNNRAAKKLFAQSLKTPTENAVAQARWASRDGSIDLGYAQLHTPHSYEARAWHYYYEGDWGNALMEANQWLDDQSFSSRPAVLGSYIASVGLADFKQGAEIAKSGLLANPSNATLINNYVYALANCGELDEAEQLILTSGILRRIEQLMPSERVVLLATEGLLEYRRGMIDSGREFYKAAITKAVESHLEMHAASAAIHLAMEEFRTKSPTGPESYSLAKTLSRGVADKGVQVLLNRLEELRNYQAEMNCVKLAGGPNV